MGNPGGPGGAAGGGGGPPPGGAATEKPMESKAIIKKILLVTAFFICRKFRKYFHRTKFYAVYYCFYNTYEILFTSVFRNLKSKLLIKVS